MNRLSSLMKIMLLPLLAVFITACSAVDIPTPTAYQLVPVAPNTSAVTRQSDQTLLVTAPEAVSGYDSDKMAYVEHPYQLGYFTKNKWAAEPTNMLEPLMVTTLQNSHRFAVVTGAPFSGFADLRLDTTLITLQQNFLTSPSQVELTIDARLVKTASQRIIAGKRFTIIVPTPRNTPDGGVQAANQAVAIFLQQLTQFLLTTT